MARTIRLALALGALLAFTVAPAADAARYGSRTLKQGMQGTDVKKPGEAIVRVRWTPYWYAANACVEPDGDWTRVIADEVGFVRLSTRFSPERLFSRGRRCDD